MCCSRIGSTAAGSWVRAYGTNFSALAYSNGTLAPNPVVEYPGNSGFSGHNSQRMVTIEKKQQAV
jgi:hypothetical protein